MPAPAHVQADTLDRFIAGWRKWTPEDWMATWSSDCVQVMLPLSLGIPPKSVAEVKGILPKLMEIVTNYEVRGSLNALFAPPTFFLSLQRPISLSYSAN